MNPQQFHHIIRAAAQITGLSEFVVVGSQAILAFYDDAPKTLRLSAELDIYPLREPSRSIEIDGAIGELSQFHSTHGIYAHGVAPDTATMPIGWEFRCVRKEILSDEKEIIVYAPSLYDLAYSKLAAGREKDIHYVSELLRCNYITRGKLSKFIEDANSESSYEMVKRSLVIVNRSQS